MKLIRCKDSVTIIAFVTSPHDTPFKFFGLALMQFTYPDTFFWI